MFDTLGYHAQTEFVKNLHGHKRYPLSHWKILKRSITLDKKTTTGNSYANFSLDIKGFHEVSM